MKQLSISSQSDAVNRILLAPDSEMKEILLEGLQLAGAHPEILERIQADLDQHALEAKQLREADKRWYEGMIDQLPNISWDECQSDDATVALCFGRPRLYTAELVFLFSLLRAHWGSITSKSARERIVESRTLQEYLDACNLSLPSLTSMLEHLNHVSNQTRQHILDVQLKEILGQGLDDFRMETIDSTACGAHSSWPTDSKILLMLLNRAYRLSQSLEPFGLTNLNNGYIQMWLDKLQRLNYRIALTSGKANSKKKIKRHYRQFLNTGMKALNKLIRQLDKLHTEHLQSSLPPSRRIQLDAVIETLHDSLYQACQVYEYSTDRIFNEVVLPAPKKILSLSDPCAAFIKKGGRDAVIGYKPQIARSANGFISAFELQLGNPSDSTRLLPMVEQHITRTGQVPVMVSTDDGYASGPGRKKVLDLGVEQVSFSGSKGRRILSEEDWSDPSCVAARSDRSAVESIIFVLKYKFGFGQLSRTGIEAATAELLEKVIVHNFWRMAYCRKHRARSAA